VSLPPLAKLMIRSMREAREVTVAVSSSEPNR